MFVLFWKKSVRNSSFSFSSSFVNVSMPETLFEGELRATCDFFLLGRDKAMCCRFVVFGNSGSFSKEDFLPW